MQKTTNYQLNQWAKSDRILMDDFNADNQKLDAALKANADAIPKLAFGSYTGTGIYGKETPASLTLPFPPKWVCIFTETWDTHVVFDINRKSSTASLSSGSNTLFPTFSGNTLSWFGGGSAASNLNMVSITYLYFALG